VSQSSTLGEKKLSGQTIIDELIRNTELGQFELTYTVLLPCVFSVYLNPEDHARLTGVFHLIAEDAHRALRGHVAGLNAKPRKRWRSGANSKEYKIASRDWIIEFFPDTEVPSGDVEIHSELNEIAQPGYCGVKTTLTGRDPSVTSTRTALDPGTETRHSIDRVYAEVRYEDDSGAQLYLMTQNEIRVGRGGADQPMDLALYANDEVSREHFIVRRDPATGIFTAVDRSTNGTWLDGRRLKKGVEEILPDRAEIKVAEAITLIFETRR
jgi:FHA domain